MDSIDDGALKALQGGRASWDAWRASHADARPDLRGASLVLDGSPGMWDLSACAMSGSRISSPAPLDLDLRASDLSRATIAPRSTIAGVRLDKNSVLTEAHFDEVTILHADFSLVVLQGTSFFHSSLHSVRFGGQLIEVNFGRATLSSVDLRDCQLLGCNLASVRVSDSDFDNARLLTRPKGPTSTLELAVLRRCSFADTDFAGCSVKSAIVADSDLRRAKGLVLDETVLIGTPTSAGAADDWSVLRRSYTGANMVFNVIAMTVFFLPFIFQALYWSGFNQAQLGMLRGLSEAEAQVARIPDGAIPARVVKALQSSIDPNLQHCLQPGLSSAKVGPPSCRPVWQILLGVHQGTFAVVLSMVLLIYNVTRLALTWFVAPLRDEEVRTWHAPRKAAYVWMIPLHRMMRFLVWVAIAAAFLHLGPHLVLPVWLPSVSSST